jgi:beta-galactosidase
VLSTRFGAGRVIYLGTRLSDDDLAALLGPLLAGDAASDISWPAGVERVVRRGPEASYEFLINHTGQPVRLTLAHGGFDLLSAAEVGGELELGPQGVAIVKF